MSKCLTCKRVESPERVWRKRDVIIGLDLAAAAGVDKACAIDVEIVTLNLFGKN